MNNSANLDALYSEHDKPTHASKRQAHDAIAPLLAIGASIQRQMTEYRSIVTAAELSDGADPNPKTEHVQQTFGAIEREVKAFLDSGRNLAKAFTQLDRYIADLKSDAAADQKAITASPPVASIPPTTATS